MPHLSESFGIKLLVLCHGGERSNVWSAYQKVVRNGGGPRVDGLTVGSLKEWLKVHWPRVRAAWWNSGASHMNHAFPKAFFDRLRLVSMFDASRYLQRHL